jgi:hypothetical protein
MGGGSCTNVVRSSHVEFWIGEETIWTSGRAVEGAKKYAGRLTVLGARPGQRRYRKGTKGKNLSFCCKGFYVIC